MKTTTVTSNGHVDRLLPVGLTPEAADRKHARRLNARLVAGVLCVVAAFSGFLVFAASSSPRTHGVVVAVRDLPTGTRVRRTDLAVAQAQLADAQAQVFVPAEAVDTIDGQELLGPVAAQQFLARAQLTTAQRPTLQPGFVRMTVPVRPDTAVGGALRTGDLVTVLATTDKGKPTAQTRSVLDRVVVDQVGQADTLTTTGTSAVSGDGSGPSLPLRASRPIAWVTLLVPEDRASSLALARWTGDIELIQLPAADDAGATTP
jgi:Flp pilus assembly protein CpaB